MPVRVVVGAFVVALPILLVHCGVGDLVNPGEGGRLAVSTPSLAEAAAVGSQALRTVTVDITSASGRAVGWSAQRAQGGAWLAFTPTAGTVPSTVTVTFDPDGLAVGEFRDTIVVRADGSDAEPLRVPVAFTIEECALSPVTAGGGDAGTLSAVDCGAPNRADHFARVYAFDGAAGDSVTVVLSSAAFDPYLVIATPEEAAPVAVAQHTGGHGERNASGDWRLENGDLQSAVRAAVPLVEASDCPFSPDDACLVHVLLPEDGTYLIEVTTEQPGETGAYTLSVALPGDPTAPGLGGLGVGQFQLGGIVQIPQGEGLAGTEGVFKGRLNDPDAFDSLRLEVEVELVGTDFNDVPTAASAMGANGDTAEVAISGLADAASYHWQARAVDNTGRAGPWMAFGTNADPGGVDFVTVVSRLPDLPTVLAQARTDGTPIATGATTPERQVRTSATVSDPDGDDVRIEVEVKPVGTDFDGTPSGASGAVASGGTAEFTIGGLTDDVSYRWRVRAADANNLFSDWVEFGGNGDEADFVVDVGASGVDPAASSVETDVTSISADGDVATITVTVVNVLGEPVVGAPVTLSATGGGNSFTQPGDTDASGVATGTFGSTEAVDKVVTAVADGVTITETVTITVEPGAASAATSQITADPTSIVANGTSVSTITVQLRDANNNDLTSSGGTVTLLTTLGNLSGVIDNEDGTYTDALTAATTPGTATITGTVAENAIADDATVQFTAGAATQLVFTVQPPTSVTVGAQFTVQVAAQDDQGTTDPTFVEDVSLAIGAGSPGGTLSGTTTVSAVNGVATFSGLSLDVAGAGYTLVASALNLPDVTSNSFAVTTGATTTTITGDDPDPSAVGEAYTVTYTVEVSAGDGTPTGGVTVSDGTDSCVGTVAEGSCELTSTTAGDKTLMATYEGDGDFTVSTSPDEPHSVTDSG